MAHVAPAAVRLVSTEAPDLPASTWTNGVRIGNEIILSGMTAYPAARDATLDCYAQTCVVLGKIRSLVEAAGGSINNIYRLVVYVTDIADKEAVGRARREFFASVGAYPCSTLVEVRKLVFPELTVEIDGFARLDFNLGALGA